MISEDLSIFRKIWSLLLPAERRSAVLLLGLMIIGMILETMGVGLVIPTLTLLTLSDIRSQYPSWQPVLAEVLDDAKVPEAC